MNFNFMTSGTLDIIILCFFLLSMALAYFRGIIKEVFTLLALYLAATATYFFGQSLVPLFNNLLGVSDKESFDKSELIFGTLSPVMASKLFSYVAVYLVAFILISVIGYFFNKAAKEAGLGKVSRISGAAFGALRTFLTILLIYAPFAVIIGYKNFPKWAKDSVTVHIADNSFEKLNGYFDLKKKIKDKTASVKAKIEKRIKGEVSKNKEEYQKRVAAGEDAKIVAKEMIDKLLEKSAGISGIPTEDIVNMAEKMINKANKTE